MAMGWSIQEGMCVEFHHSTRIGSPSVMTTVSKIERQVACILLLSIARFQEGDRAILKGQGEEASIEISTRDIIKMRDK